MPDESTDGSPGPGPRDPRGGDGEPFIPPTAAASVPSLADVEVPSPGRPPGAGPLPAGGGPTVGRDVPTADGARAERPPAIRPPFDRSVRPALLGVVVAVVALLGAEQLDTPVFVFLCWLVALVAIATAIVSGNRARYRITNHPERRRGLLPAMGALLAGVVLLIGTFGGFFLAVRSAPIGDAPILGSSSGIERLRWGYQRFRIVQRNGWHSVAREPGSCWGEDPEDSEREKRDELDRDEQALRRISCGREHSHEVLGVYAIDPRADVAYSEGDMLVEALDRCRDDWGETAPRDGSYVFEWPTEVAWERGDHDVACLLHASGKGSVRSD